MTEENTIFKSSLNKAMHLCSRREYCISDIKNKLQTWGINESESDKIISVLKKENFINEMRYSEAYVKDKYNQNKWGKIKIKSRLKMKSIPSDLIEKALEYINEDTYIQRLRDILAERKKHIKAKNRYEMKGKLYRYGMSKGFESSLLTDILDDIV